jgi:hypothetical protein
MELSNKTTTSVGPSAARTTAHVSGRKNGTSGAFEAPPIVTVLCRVYRSVAFGQLIVAFEDGTCQIVIPFCCEVYAILDTHLFQCVTGCLL